MTTSQASPKAAVLEDPSTTSHADSTPQSGVTPGADILLQEKLETLRGKRIALVTNHTGRLGSGEPLADALVRNGITVVRLFGPEHGIRGVAPAGETVADSVDVKTGIPVVSLYGKIHKPTPEMLRDVDLLIYDVQVVGARFYTYISTMALCMEAAAEAKIPFVVLDRPNPLGCVLVDGPVLDDSLRSFVGIAPIPTVYGLTSGELARFLNGERMLAGGVQADLEVIAMKGWNRQMRWNDTKLEWVPPSPNIRSPEAAIVYPATCYIEATNVSEGRGTEQPFLTIGAPFIDGKRLARELTRERLGGVEFMPTVFTPVSSKWKGEKCEGVSIGLTDPEKFRPLKTGLRILWAFQRLYPDKFKVQKHSFERLFGAGGIYEKMFGTPVPLSESAQGAREAEIQKILGKLAGRTEKYASVSRNYWIYPLQ